MTNTLDLAYDAIKRLPAVVRKISAFRNPSASRASRKAAAASRQGEIIQVRKQPQTTQNVVTYTVVASAPNPDLLLLPGMTATVNIIVSETLGALAVPIAALRFRPPGAARSAETRVFVQRSGEVLAVSVGVGASDRSHVVITGGGLREGDRVITGLAAPFAESGSRPDGILGRF